MASQTQHPKVSIRRALESDINAIVALLLTSFRQFPLFDFLYAPLNENFDVAHDTVFFWRRRLLLDLLDPEVTILVAEAPLDSLTVQAGSIHDEEQGYHILMQSRRALEWVERNGLLT